MCPRAHDIIAIFQQTSPHSHFTQHRVCSRATPEGRITLRDTKLIKTVYAERTEEALAGENAFREALRLHFGIEANTFCG